MVRIAGLLARNGFEVSILPVLNADTSVAPDIHPIVRIDKFEGEHYFSIWRPFKKVFLEKKFGAIFGAVFLSLKNVYKTFWVLASYIKKTSPDVILTAHYNCPTIFAAMLARSRSKIVITEHIILSEHFAGFSWAIRNFYFCMCRLFYPRADKIVGVSKSVVKDLEARKYSRRANISVIYNPALPSNIDEMAAAPISHPWLPGTPEAPVFVAAGQLNRQKDYPTLLKALASLRKRLDARLIVLGRGALLESLQALSRELGIENSVDWLGFVSNPIPYMKNSGLFVLSSVFEVLPTVIIEALAVGASVVGTDSPGGIREILGDNQWGRLVPVGDHEALADAMYENWKNPFDKDFLKARADFFSEAKAAEGYTALIKELLL
ncbi:MAG: glycosyltransferase [Synergistaceae bacterium]|nr:glycosyltransferase [Synergistaceae bacterium]